MPQHNSYSVCSRLMDRIAKIEAHGGQKIGYFYFLLSNIIFCCNSICIQQVHGLGVYELLYYRGIFSFIINWTICTTQNIDVYLNSPSTTRKLFVRGLNAFLGFGLFVYGLQNMTLSEATTLFQCGPMFTSLFAMYYLKEKFECLQGVTIALCLFGSLLVLKPPFLFPSNQIEDHGNKNRLLGGICCLLTAITAGASYNLVRELRNQCHGQTTVHYNFLVMSLMTPLFVLIEGVKVPTIEQTMYFILMGILTTLHQSLFTRGLKFGTAGKSSIMGYSSILFTMMLDIILHHPLDYLSIIGAMSIFSCVIVIFLEKKK